MKKILIIVTLLLFNTLAQCLEVKSHGKSSVEITPQGTYKAVFLEAPQDWPQIEFKFGKPVKKINLINLEIKKLSSETGKIIVLSKPRSAIKNIYIEKYLKDGESTKISIPVKNPDNLESITIAARKPKSKVVLEIKKPYLSYMEKAVKTKLKPIPPVTFNGKAFFPLGCYDTFEFGKAGKLLSIDPGFLKAGGNITNFGAVGMPGRKYYNRHCQPAVFSALKKIKDDPRFKNLALMINLSWDLLTDDSDAGKKRGIGASLKPAEGEAKAERIKILKEAVCKLKKYPNIIGYTMDEPENLIWKYYNQNYRKQWLKFKDIGLSAKILEWMGWTVEVIRKNDPDAKLIPIIAWWTNYKALSPMYDVIIANTYPKSSDKKEFSAPLYTVSYDAYMAVKSARESGGNRSVIFMPPMFDILKGGYTICTLAEQRYVCFAPITRGAMGIFGWRLQRCSPSHRKNVIYPVMSDISKLSGFFLGAWHDELISSDQDKTTFEYLKKYKERIRLTNNEDGNIITDDHAVPNISYCLRKNKEGKYLLLVVNNSREKLKARIKITLKKLPRELSDYFDEHKVLIGDNGEFTDTFTPFDVHAYIF